MDDKLEYIKDFLKSKNTVYAVIPTENEVNNIYNLFKNGDLEYKPKTEIEYLYWGWYHFVVTKNYDKAEKWFMMGAELGNHASMNILSRLPNKIQAIEKLYTKIIEFGNSEAMTIVGLWHLRKTKNYDEMEKWFMMAIKLGDDKSTRNLKTYYAKNDKLNEFYIKMIKIGKYEYINNLFEDEKFCVDDLEKIIDILTIDMSLITNERCKILLTNYTLQKRVERLEELVEQLMYAPPGEGGPYYQQAKGEFEQTTF